ncbi:MAG TPA: OmpH family outer membrane protein [Candidatus Acidoferrales bacterium]|nr:OmpH family outer membrane protein [Candidatus Acidoferrales bacterium]
MNINDHRVSRWISLAVLLLTVTVGARAQGGGNSAAASAPTKVGTLNVRDALFNTAEGRQALAELQSQFAPRQNELQNLNKQIEELQNRLRSGERTLSDEEKARLQRQGELMVRQLQRKQDEAQEEFNAAQAEVSERIQRKLSDVLDRYARENSYAVVFDTSGQNAPVIYRSSSVDITQDIIRLYDQAHPVKGGAATAPAPRPTAPQPRPTSPPPSQPKPTTPAPTKPPR